MERQKFFIIGKVHVLIIIIKKRSIKKRLKKRSEKKNMENTHTRVMLKREVVLHKKCRKNNPFSTLLSSVSFFRPTHTKTTRTTLTTTTRIYISSSSTNGRPGAR